MDIHYQLSQFDFNSIWPPTDVTQWLDYVHLTPGIKDNFKPTLNVEGISDLPYFTSHQGTIVVIVTCEPNRPSGKVNAFTREIFANQPSKKAIFAQEKQKYIF